jgi:hypothetical protein
MARPNLGPNYARPAQDFGQNVLTSTKTLCCYLLYGLSVVGQFRPILHMLCMAGQMQFDLNLVGQNRLKY